MSRLLSLFVCFLLVFSFTAVAPALADCPDGDSGDNVINCTSDPGGENGDDDVDGESGDDTITIGEGATISHLDADGQTVEGDDEGVGDGGDDSIVNNGAVNSGIYGDYVEGDGGDDTIINNGSTGYITGDDATGDGGDDLIVNNGSVEGNIEGDTVQSDGGDDTLIINGSVSGDILGDMAGGTGGDDLIELQNGASGGDDSLLFIDGDSSGLAPKALGVMASAGNDTLVFNFSTRDEDEYDDLIDQFATAVASTSATGSGTLSFRGQTFQWINIEELRNLIRLIIEQSGGSGEVVLADRDARINEMTAPVAIYCAPDGGVHVYGIDANGSGIFLFGASGQQIAATVAAGGGVVAEAGGAVLAANASGELLFTLGGYNFSFSAAVCALPV